MATVQSPRTVVTATLDWLLDRANTRLTYKPKLVTLAPGTAVAMDECCEGELWARVSGVVPVMSTTKPVPSMHCAILGWRVSAGIGLARCVHGLQDGGYFPTAAEMGDDFDRLMLDMEELSQALLCDFPEMPAVRSVALGRWTPFGPDSMCAGGEWTFDYTLPYCGC